MSVETQHLDATGKKLIDGCTIRVIDTLKGTDKEVREHSGGERSTLAEAINSGITMLACRRAGFDRPTLIRDESTVYLDEELAPLWIRMMRHVVEFTNADRLLFVSHNRDIVRLADATIEPPERRTTEIGAAA
jgi:DNA repair exonuclease SbcCD ATPase subunit